MGNLWNLPAGVSSTTSELFETLAQGGGTLIERIVSAGHTTPEGQWYDQARDEWVALLQGEASLEYADGEVRDLRAGDHLLIPAGMRHRVRATSVEPRCIWIAVHADLSAVTHPAPPEVLRDGALILRRQRLEHAEAIVAAVRRSIAEVGCWMPWGPGAREEANVRQFLRACEDAWVRGAAHEYAIFDADGATLLGGAGLNRIDLQNGVANLGYWVTTEATGRGVATAAAKLILSAAFEALPVHRIELIIAQNNHASLAVAAKLGAQREALLRERARVGDGSYADAWLCALLRSG